MKSFKSFVPHVALCAGTALGANAAHAGIPVVDVSGMNLGEPAYAGIPAVDIERLALSIQAAQAQMLRLELGRWDQPAMGCPQTRAQLRGSSHPTPARK
jgi:hypothetical protein